MFSLFWKNSLFFAGFHKELLITVQLFSLEKLGPNVYNSKGNTFYLFIYFFFWGGGGQGLNLSLTMDCDLLVLVSGV